ncbi:MAG: PspA/IM30 family protein, partial [Gammaproteobacteria bacterium]|nr:PspA/IM30 family protein [Gammaproteobacteria bacterium]NIR99347.1 PspA/IM30 family protein [Gammaproteobacteria bacterium]NIT64958.1 PspA/IM30 family protein [Gammaproteobacteria bacterium]NIV21993.1 PspA/IM30 family protein [Gammaproteobacteria bacterium]NIY33537.1 PspA/IM30 family protein [Gammaproteobacteria bacterium]
IAEIRRKKNLLVSKQRRAEAQDQIYQTIEGVQSMGAVDTIERMENKIEEMSALADARHELSNEFSGDQLEQRFAELDA